MGRLSVKNQDEVICDFNVPLILLKEYGIIFPLTFQKGKIPIATRSWKCEISTAQNATNRAAALIGGLLITRRELSVFVVFEQTGYFWQ